MSGPSLLIPAVVVFIMLVIGLVLTMREFYKERGLGDAPLDHTPRVVKKDAGQARRI